MSSRLRHRLTLFLDRDIAHAGVVAAAACVLSAGLVYAGYLVHVVRIARRAPCAPQRGQCLLLFGKHTPVGVPDAEFAQRIERAAQVWDAHRLRTLVLLGGGVSGAATEAALAQRALLARGVPREALRLEDASRDTLQNLRNARDLLGESDVHTPLTLLSSRYHLARCALFARQLGLDAEVCAAEPRLTLSPKTLWRLAGEAGYVCLTDIGTRWARLIGHRRMLARVT